MNKLHNEFDPLLIALLEELKPTPERNPRVAARARAQFLAEAVSVRNQRRLSLWTIFQRKEQLAMNLFMSIILIAGLLFGGGATVSAAQDDLPDEALYPIKLLSEDVNLWLISDPQAEIKMLMRQAQTRTQEMANLMEKGRTPPAELSVRAQKKIQRALQLAASLDEPALQATLQQIRAQLQSQEQLMTQLQDGTCTACEPVLQQTREMLRIQLRQIDSGLDQPPSSPNQNRDQNQLRTTQTPAPTEETTAPQASHTPVLNGTGQQNGNGNPSAATPMPQNHSGNQDGNGTQDNPEGGNGNNDGSGNGNGSGEGNGTGGGNDSGQGSGGQGGKP